MNMAVRSEPYSSNWEPIRVFFWPLLGAGPDGDGLAEFDGLQ